MGAGGGGGHRGDWLRGEGVEYGVLISSDTLVMTFLSSRTQKQHD